MDESASIMSQVKNDIANRISDAIYKAKEKGDLPGYLETEIKIETPARPEQGDFATGVAMSLAREVQSDGRSVAGIIVRYLSLDDSWIQRVDIAGPGFSISSLGPDGLIRPWQRYGRKAHYMEGLIMAKANVSCLSLSAQTLQAH